MLCFASRVNWQIDASEGVFDLALAKNQVRFIQTQLNARGLDAGTADGDLGPRTHRALSRVGELVETWPKKRKAVGFIQLLATENNIEAGPLDGYWGPQPAYAYEAIREKLEARAEPVVWRPESLPDLNPNDWPNQDPESELTAFYGDVGIGQTSLDLPYPHRLSWD